MIVMLAYFYVDGLPPNFYLQEGNKLMRKTPLKRTAMKRKPRRGGSMPQEVYQAVMGRAGGRCEAAIGGVCTGTAQDWHHRQRRQAGNDIVVNGLALCRACHHHITFVSPAEGKTRGLIISAFATDIAARPFYARGAWWLLSEDGSKKIISRSPLGEGWEG